MGLNGTFFNAMDEEKTKYTPVKIPLRDPKGKDA
jgi:hypothetical protein